jgi:hypothetical protein
MTPPCKDCSDRQLGCHGQCERYQAFRAKKEREAQKRAEMSVITDIMKKAKERSLKATVWKK